ncbi:MAG: hypothetical protein ACLSV7_00905 [Oscillospiraceae bacterium]|nr:hypothetical protein [Bacillota bacterium]
MGKNRPTREIIETYDFTIPTFILAFMAAKVNVCFSLTVLFDGISGKWWKSFKNRQTFVFCWRLLSYTCPGDIGAEWGARARETGGSPGGIASVAKALLIWYTMPELREEGFL